MDKFSDECGIVAIIQKGNLDVSQTAYFGLNGLQHRGQESTGLAVCNDKTITCYKDKGLVSEVFDDKILTLLKGDMCLGHVKYSTEKDNLENSAQPLVVEYKNGTMAIAFNGGIVNAKELREEMEDNGIMFQTKSDVEVIAALIVKHDKGDIVKAITHVLTLLKGGFAIGIMTKTKIIGIRDKFGIRPLAIGKTEKGYMLASESCAFDMMGATIVRDLSAGEIVVLENDEINFFKTQESHKKATCIFEHVYFARPDSVIDGVSVYKCREIAGEILAEESPLEADYVIGVPDSGTPAAIGFSIKSGIPYTVGLIKNKYIGRTFIQPTQLKREMGVKIKLNPIKEVIDGKRIVIVDDSIVRGTTMKKLIETLKNAGAKEVHLRISSPPVLHCCYYGVDTPDKKDLIANVMTIDEIRKTLGASSLAFISVEGLLRSVGSDENSFCTACFNGNYPVL